MHVGSLFRTVLFGKSAFFAPSGAKVVVIHSRERWNEEALKAMNNAIKEAPRSHLKSKITLDPPAKKPL